jgi:cell wall-associated NlpC family hydrolase
MPLSDQIRTEIVRYAERFLGTPHDEMDCSHFVYYVYKHFLPNFPYMPSSRYLESPLFRHIGSSEMKPADLILWNGHIAVLVNPIQGSFIGSQTSTGVAVATMSNPYWQQRRPLALLTLC